MNLHQEGEFRDKLDFIVKKISQIQIDVSVLKGSGSKPNATLPDNVRPAKAAEMIGVSNATFYKYVREQPGFPQPMRTSSRCSLYSRAEIQAWLDDVKKTPKKYRAGKTRGLK